VLIEISKYMDTIPNLEGPAPNNISWTTIHGVDQLRGSLRPPYTDNRNLAPPFQIWDLVLHMFDVALERYVSQPTMRYILRLGFGIAGTNRYNHSIRGTLGGNIDPNSFFNKMERMLNSNDSYDIRHIQFVMDFIN
jgi:hypothetical protein